MNPLIIFLLMAMAAPLPSFQNADAAQSETAAPAGLLVLRGHIVCLDSTGKRLDALLGCNGSNLRYSLSDKDGKLHNFSAIDASTAVFTDARVRQRELQITAQMTARHQLDIVRVQSIREGRLYDLYYF